MAAPLGSTIAATRYGIMTLNAHVGRTKDGKGKGVDIAMETLAGAIFVGTQMMAARWSTAEGNTNVGEQPLNSYSKAPDAEPDVVIMFRDPRTLVSTD